jgi:hypothetical protein
VPSYQGVSEDLFPCRGEVDWSVLEELAFRPHPLVNNDWTPPDPDTHYAGEMFAEIRNAHHLLDRAGVPHGYSIDTRDIDCRVLLLVMAFERLRDR